MNDAADSSRPIQIHDHRDQRRGRRAGDFPRAQQPGHNGSVPRACLALDEAYYEYLPERPCAGARLARAWPNLIVLRTFSKAYGLAGLRVGYMIAHPYLVSLMRLLCLPFATACVAAGVNVQPFADDGIRVSIGSTEENNAFLTVAERHAPRGPSASQALTRRAQH